MVALLLASPTLYFGPYKITPPKNELQLRLIGRVWNVGFGFWGLRTPLQFAFRPSELSVGEGGGLSWVCARFRVSGLYRA